ncbi:lycopene cyclase domain-containing protein [Curtobacterium sp. MCBD17_032]|uniref:lycopene cyclase domain-containing protein n=1 Tax=Curtobacterium sp. MCBD17_032 TaxID=2175659 RepID=UPI000DAA0A2A|nr:lycopene cyclase domain-containing protein [Curtobacterium sp. MCBD17_032]PZE86176.1 lycopene cyclase domain-containing protein [Curtobacterium sp. MCBD17_032]
MTGAGTYALLAVPFLGTAVLVAVVAGVVTARRTRGGTRSVRAAAGDGTGAPSGSRGRRAAVVSAVVAGVALIVMTCVFNNVIVGLGIVAYDPALVLGARVGLFPVEDLAYAIGAVLLLPSCWVLLDRPVRSERPSQPSRSPEDTP